MTSAPFKSSHGKYDLNRWWVVVPDHISYFNFENVPPILERLGFCIEDTMGDYPMEFFLLMGRDYISQPELGRACHLERVELEMSMPAQQPRHVPWLCTSRYRPKCALRRPKRRS